MSSALIKSIVIVFIVLIGSVVPLKAQSTKLSENEYADYIQSLIGGQREVSVKSGRVDILTKEYAFEVEWANKWKDAIGQSIWYGVQTNKKSGIILIMKKKEDYKYFIQLNTALEYADLTNKIKVYLFPTDFEELTEEKNKEKEKRK